VFKGGGFVLRDLAAMLRASGLAHAITVTQHIREAHCVVAKVAWSRGRRAVNLEQHRSAAHNRGIPFLVVGSLRARELVLRLKPLLMERGMLQQEQSRPDLHVLEAVQRPAASSQSAASSSPLPPPTTCEAVQKLQQHVLEGALSLPDFLALLQNPSSAPAIEEQGESS
jgi:hypothetical protein